LVNSIKINLEMIESMIYYWKATSEKQKVGEPFIIATVSSPLMKPLYGSDFTEESARKVLSAISNREIFKPETKAEGRFWNNQMWMMEDLGVMEAMAASVKTLNLDYLVPALETDETIEQLDVVFLPGHIDTVYKAGNHLYVNFFKITGVIDGNGPEIEEMPLKEFLFAKLKEMLQK